MNFCDVPLNTPFWDPFVRRSFVKIDNTRAKCLTYPFNWTVDMNEFGEEEDVFVLQKLAKSITNHLNDKCKNILKHNKSRSKGTNSK